MHLKNWRSVAFFGVAASIACCVTPILAIIGSVTLAGSVGALIAGSIGFIVAITVSLLIIWIAKNRRNRFSGARQSRTATR